MEIIWQTAAVVLTVAVAVSLRFIPKLRGYQFTAWIIVAVTAGMIFPNAFKQWGGVNKKKAGRLLDGRTWDQMPSYNDVEACLA